tara:strand:+ start:173 stop:577 length:405 start_codon:yes stop_codon:yes gene_type:complete
MENLKDLKTISGTTKTAVQAISQCLFQTEIQMHITHLQAIHKSFEIHNALGDFYKSLGDLNDDLVEKSFPKTGLMLNYKNISIVNELEPIPYIKKEMSYIETQRAYIKEGYIQQMIDNILETFGHVIYKLENLK